MKEIIKRIPVFNSLARLVYFSMVEPTRPFNGSGEYWKKRYESGGNSGAGSYHRLAAFKAEVLNGFVRDNEVTSVVELGCGDGNQLQLAQYPQYLGVDVIQDAVDRCRKLFAGDTSKSFVLLGDTFPPAELALSLDVIYHLVEDEVFDAHMQLLFASAMRFVIIYSSNTNRQEHIQGSHVKHRKFTDWIERQLPEWQQIDFIPNTYPFTGDDLAGSFADFYIFAKA